MTVFSALCLEALAWGDGGGGGYQPAAPIGAQEGAAMGCAWLPRCFRQQALHFSAAGFESPGDKLSSKIARKKLSVRTGKPSAFTQRGLHTLLGAGAYCLIKNSD